MKKGSKIKFIGASDDQVKWGSNDDPRDVLKINEIYTIKEVEVHSWHTKIYLEEAPGKFNSVHFREMVNDNETAMLPPFFETNKYYRKKRQEESLDVDCDYYFKCEKIINETDAFGIELVITPGKNLFHIHCSAHFDFSGWEEISQEEFIDRTIKYSSQIAERFS
jgi:hypothetical protein